MTSYTVDIRSSWNRQQVIQAKDGLDLIEKCIAILRLESKFMSGFQWFAFIDPRWWDQWVKCWNPNSGVATFNDRVVYGFKPNQLG